MKKIKFFILPMILIAFIFSAVLFNSITSVQANAITPIQGKITVMGFSENFYTPDSAKIVMGVETTNEVVSVAQSENDTIIQKAMETLSGYGITEDNIKTSSYEIRDNYDYYNFREDLGSKVVNLIEFKTTNLDGLDELLTTLGEDGVNVVRGVNFSLSNYATSYNEVLFDAIENAKTKASILSGTDNLTIIEICENCGYGQMFYDSMSSLKASPYSTISKGDLKISANVQVVFQVDNTTDVLNNMEEITLEDETILDTNTNNEETIQYENIDVYDNNYDENVTNDTNVDTNNINDNINDTNNDTNTTNDLDATTDIVDENTNENLVNTDDTINENNTDSLINTDDTINENIDNDNYYTIEDNTTNSYTEDNTLTTY